MNEEKIKQLYDLLVDFATLPCDVKKPCKDFCPFYNYCSMAYYMARGIKGELTVDETFNKVEADYKNTKWMESINQDNKRCGCNPLRDLKIGDNIMYIGDESKFFSYNGLYAIVNNNLLELEVVDNDGDIHSVSADFYKDNFIY